MRNEIAVWALSLVIWLSACAPAVSAKRSRVPMKEGASHGAVCTSDGGAGDRVQVYRCVCLPGSLSKQSPESRGCVLEPLPVDSGAPTTAKIPASASPERAPNHQ